MHHLLETGQESVLVKELEVYTVDVAAAAFSASLHFLKVLRSPWAKQQHLSYFLMTERLTERRRVLHSCLLLIHRRIYVGKPSAQLLGSRNLCASVSTKTIAPATVSYSKSAPVCSIIGWGFRWKGTAGEKAFFGGGNGSRPRKKSSFQRATMGDWDRGGVPSWLAHLMARLLNFCIH